MDHDGQHDQNERRREAPRPLRALEREFGIPGLRHHLAAEIRAGSVRALRIGARSILVYPGDVERFLASKRLKAATGGRARVAEIVRQVRSTHSGVGPRKRR